MRLLVELAQYAVVLLVELLLRCLSPRGIVGLTRAAGTGWYLTDRRRRKRALASIGVAARGGLPVDDPERLTLAACRNLIRVPVETMVFPRFFHSRRHFVERCRFVGDVKQLVADLRSGRGGLLVSGHLGNWEVAAWTMQYLGVPFRTVVRPIENRFINRRATGTRGGEGGLIAKRGAVRGMLRTLRENGWIATMADQNAGRRGEFVPFFGLEASTYSAPAVLAIRTGVPFYAAAVLRVPGRLMEFEFHVKRLEEPGPAVSESERARVLIRNFASTLEGFIRLAPERSPRAARSATHDAPRSSGCRPRA